MAAGALEILRREEVTQPLTAPLGPAIAALTEAVRSSHGGAVSAVLFYGSCLRLNSETDKIVDLYVLVDSYTAAYGRGLRALANWALPPNVFYLEVPFEGRKLRAKYALISLGDFRAGTSGGWFHPYLWARFAQPCRLVYCRDAAAEEQVVAALAGAVRKVLDEGLALAGGEAKARDLWVGVFRQTYRTELRAEPPERAGEIYEMNADHYAQLAAAALPDPAAMVPASGGGGGWRWPLRRLQGKLLSVARLVKAAFTFQDGPQYLLWKIERHSGVTVTLTPWQQRHPILASPLLFWRLYRKGAFR
jgi:hypothetical protein